MSEQISSKKRKWILVAFAFLLYAATIIERPFHRWLIGFLCGLPIYSSFLFPEQSRWKWLLFGIGIGLYTATYIYPLVHL
ncbi:MAG: hypothetical protein WAN35_17715 [Terracidiphilus sp.]